MGSLNKVQLIGNLGRDMELRYTPGGTAVGTINVATSEQWKDKDGQKQERTEWSRCVLWGKMAESLADFLKKGKQVYLEGQLQTRKWQDKDGNDKWTTEIKVFRVVLLGGGGSNGRRRDEVPIEDEPAGGEPVSQDPVSELTDDDIPF